MSDISLPLADKDTLLALKSQEVLDSIKSDINNHFGSAKRSLQKNIGPSETASSCDRRIGYRLLGQSKTNYSDPWYAILGTALHAWMADCYATKNKQLGYKRYLIEHKVSVIKGLSGHLDLFDTEDGIVFDWKLVGDSTMKKAAANPNEVYNDQICQYALGLHKQGHAVKYIAIVFLPRNGRLSKSQIQMIPFDIKRAEGVVYRYLGIKSTVKSLKADAIPLLNTDPEGCFFCPFYLSGSPDLTVGCPGHIAA